SIGALCQKILERLVAREVCRVAQELRRRLKKLPVLFVVRNGLELAVRPSSYSVEVAGGALAFLIGKSLRPGIEFVFGYIVGLNPRLRGFLARNAFDKGLVFIEPRPGAFIDHEIM